MKCENCGFEYDEAVGNCPNCNGVVAEHVSVNPAADKVLGMLKDSLFLVICILVSVSCVFSLSTGGVPLIQILIAVFLWIAFAQGSKGFADSSQLRNISGTIYANYVLTNIAVISFLVLGSLLGLAWHVITDIAVAEGLIDELVDIIGADYTYLVENLFNISGTLVAGVVVGISVAFLLINVLGFRKIHRLAKSVYQSVDFCVPNFENVKGAKNWMIVFAVLELISSASGFFNGQANAAITSGCLGVCYILGNILISKYLTDK